MFCDGKMKNGNGQEGNSQSSRRITFLLLSYAVKHPHLFSEMTMIDCYHVLTMLGNKRNSFGDKDKRFPGKWLFGFSDMRKHLTVNLKNRMRKWHHSIPPTPNQFPYSSFLRHRDEITFARLF